MFIVKPEHRNSSRGRFLITTAPLLLWSNTAHAQRVPLILVGVAGTGLFAPFVAVPVKLLILRVITADATAARLWSISAIEWLLWFPVTAIVVLSGGPIALAFVVPLQLAAAVWLHKRRLDNSSWIAALLLSLPTPILAVAMPSLAFVSAPLYEYYIPAWLS